MMQQTQADNHRVLETAFSVFTKTMVKIVNDGSLGTIDEKDYVQSPDTANNIAVVLQNKLRGN